MPKSRKIILLLLALLALLIGGTAGYALIEGWSWFDGLYMTVITLATIGYGEVHQLSQAGRAFTILLIFFGVAFFGFLLSLLTQTLIESEFANRFGRRKVFKSIDQLNQHYILCGAGKVGLRIIEEMKRKNVDVVIIERDEAVVVCAKTISPTLLRHLSNANDFRTISLRNRFKLFRRKHPNAEICFFISGNWFGHGGLVSGGTRASYAVSGGSSPDERTGTAWRKTSRQYQTTHV